MCNGFCSSCFLLYVNTFCKAPGSSSAKESHLSTKLFLTNSFGCTYILITDNIIEAIATKSSAIASVRTLCHINYNLKEYMNALYIKLYVT